MNLNNKKNEELGSAELFCAYLNRKRSTDYYAITNSEEDSNNEFVDVYAKSKSGTFDTLLLQIKNADREFRFQQAERAKWVDRFGEQELDVWVRDIDPIKWVKQSLDNYKSKYDVSIRSRLILILRIDHANQVDCEYFKVNLPNTNSIDYLAVYYVNPNIGRERLSQVLPIKSLL